MLASFLSLIIGLAIGGAVAWWGGQVLDLLQKLRRERPESSVVRPPVPSMVPKGPVVLSGVIKPPSPKQVAREAMEEARNK